MKLTTAQKDRAAGVMAGLASGDALGAGYEFGPPLNDDQAVAMNGGGVLGWAPGEWTDDTSMSIPILRLAQQGADLRNESTQNRLVAQWADWSQVAPDVGVQTSAVLRVLRSPTADEARAQALRLHERTGRTAGNGSLMRTAPVALAFLDDDSALAEAARSISELTHADVEAGDACVLWTVAIRRAVLDGLLELESGLSYLPRERQQLWRERIREAENKRPCDFDRNGWVVHALQGAWSAIVGQESVGAARTVKAIEAAVRGGRDTDTVAAIAGSLIGAVHGVSSIPFSWRRIVHGWPGLDLRDIADAAVEAAGGDDTRRVCPQSRIDYAATHGNVSSFAVHPFDNGVYLGAVGVLDNLPKDVDAVVSLCRVGTDQVPRRFRRADHVLVRLVDDADPAKNLNLDAVLLDAVDAIAALRDESKTVFVHCVQAMSRTPSVAALYAIRHCGADAARAWSAVSEVLPDAQPKQFLVDAVAKVVASNVMGRADV